MRVVASLLSVLLVAVPSLARAQQADSLPFRARQWGAEFTPGSSFASAGVLRFRGRATATVLDVGGGYGEHRQTGGTVHGSSTYARLRIGQRWYRAIAPHLQQFVALGPSVSYLGSDQTEPTVVGGRHVREQRTTRVGLFGELGAGWMVTPHLSLAAVWTALANYEHSTNRDVLNETELRGKSSSFDATAGSVSLRVGLYF